MSDDRVEMSVAELRLFRARAKQAERRSGKKCECEHNAPTPLVRTKKLGVKRVLLARHGALHGVWRHRGCAHSTLAETTARVLLFSRDPLSHLRPIPTVVIR